MPMSEEMAVAAEWLGALRVQDRAALSRMTRYPFEWLDTGPPSCTAAQRANNSEELARVFDCLLGREVLLRVLNDHYRAGIQRLAPGHLQEWAQPWQARAAPDAALVNAFITRNDAQVDVDLWIAGGAVQSVWTHVEDGTAAVKIATRWLDALQRRDLETLAQVTSYAFEVRDAGHEALCGKRTAAQRAQLDAAVRCLLRSKELNQAFQARAPIVEAVMGDTRVPSWAESWWKPAHAGLSQTYTGVSTPEGASFDIVLLVAPDGVRTFWKYGALEARD